MDKYYLISNKYNYNLSDINNSTIIELFDSAKQIDNINGINDVFIKLFSYHKLTIDQIEFMINLGVDLMYQPDLIFFAACKRSDIDVLQFLITRCNPNIKKISKNIWFITRNKSYLITKLLLDNDLQITVDDIIEIFCDKSNILVPKLQLVYDYVTDKREIFVAYSKLYKINIINCTDTFINNKWLPITTFIIDKLKNVELEPEIINKCLRNIICCTNISLSDFVDIINLGANVRYDNDIFFVLLCKWPSIEILTFLIDNYQLDISNNTAALVNAIKYNHVETAHFLLNLGCTITNDVIIQAYQSKSSTKYLSLLVDYKVDAKEIANVIVDHIFLSQGKSAMKFLIDYGVDFNNVISNYK